MKVGYVILDVVDMDRSLRFYRDTLALTVQSTGGEFTFLDCGNIALGLRTTERVDAGNVEIVLSVDDIYEAYETLKDAGIVFRVEPRQVMSDGERSLYATDFRDPDGHAISITGWVG